ncbi:MAG: hypothetical protein ACFCA4_12490 [Cyanophyceae cyanobacterium]
MSQIVPIPPDRIVPITPDQVLPAIHPDHHQGSYGQIVQLCQAQAYGELAQMLQGYRAFLTQEFNKGAIAASSDQHAQLVGQIIALQGRANNLAAAVQQNTQQLSMATQAINQNTDQLGMSNQQLNRLNNNLEAYLQSQAQQQLRPQPPVQVHILNEVHGHGGDGGRAIADSKSESQSDSPGWGWSVADLWVTLVVAVLFVGLVGAIQQMGQPPQRPARSSQPMSLGGDL